MREHDSVQTIDVTVAVMPGTHLLHEELIESPLAPLQTNMISLWKFSENETPIINVLKGSIAKTSAVYIELWTVPYYTHKEGDEKEVPTYSKPLNEAIKDIIAVKRSRSYMRVVARDMLIPARIKVRLKIAVDRRRLKTSWDHVRNPGVLRGDALKPGESRILRF